MCAPTSSSSDDERKDANGRTPDPAGPRGTRRSRPRRLYGAAAHRGAVVVAAFVVQACLWGAFNSFSVFVVSMGADLGLSRAPTTGAFALGIAAFGVGNLVVGLASAKLPLRYIVVTCALMSGLGYTAMAYVRSALEMYLVFSLLVGLGLAGSFVPLTSIVARWFVDRRGLVTGIVMAGSGIGTIAVPSLTGQLIHHVGWRAAYLWLGGGVIAIAFCAAALIAEFPAHRGLAPYRRRARVLSETRAGSAQVERDSEVARRWAERLGLSKPVQNLLPIWIIHGCVGAGIYAHMFPRGLTHGLDREAATTAVSLLGAGGILGCVLLGFVGDRCSHRTVLSVSFLAMAVASALLAFSPVPEMFQLGAVLFGLTWSGSASLVPPMLAGQIGSDRLGLALGTLELCWAVSGGVGALALGWCFDVTGDYVLGTGALCGLCLAAVATCSRFAGGR